MIHRRTLRGAGASARMGRPVTRTLVLAYSSRDDRRFTLPAAIAGKYRQEFARRARIFGGESVTGKDGPRDEEGVWEWVKLSCSAEGQGE